MGISSQLKYYDAAGTAQAKVDELANGAVKANADAITKLNGDATLEGSVDKKVKDASDALRQQITDSTYDDTAIQAKVSANETAIGVLNGTGEGSVAKKVADEVAKVVGGADESMDTLKEVSDWISNHADSAAPMQTKINANENAINTLNGTGEGSVKKTAADAVAKYAAGAGTSLEVLEQLSAWLKGHPAGIVTPDTECLELLTSQSRNIRTGPRLDSSVRVAQTFQISQNQTAG